MNVEEHFLTVITQQKSLIITKLQIETFQSKFLLKKIHSLAPIEVLEGQKLTYAGNTLEFFILVSIGWIIWIKIFTNPTINFQKYSLLEFLNDHKVHTLGIGGEGYFI